MGGSAVASALYVGTVRHRRHRPATNAFRYGVFHALLDVDELPRLDRELRGFGYNRRAAVGFRDTDHLGDAARPVREKLAARLAEEGVTLPGGRVLVWCNLRVLGYVFDPVSWWFCHDADGRLALVVAEVRNTFGAAHSYVLDDLEPHADGTVRARADKVLRVSPFLGVAGHRYRFAFVPPRGRPGERITAHIDVLDDEGRVLDATQAERRVALTSRNLWRAMRRYPLVTLRTMYLIHRQALRLWRLRVPFLRAEPASPPAPTADGPAAIPTVVHTERPDVGDPRTVTAHAPAASRLPEERAS